MGWGGQRGVGWGVGGQRNEGRGGRARRNRAMKGSVDVVQFTRRILEIFAAFRRRYFFLVLVAALQHVVGIASTTERQLFPCFSDYDIDISRAVART